jgi:hypothetical protein
MQQLLQVVAVGDRGAFDRAMAELTRRSAELVAEPEHNKN